jgi:hypothetical protein
VSDTVQQAVAATQQAIVRVLTEGIDLQSLSVDERKKLADELRKGSAHETEKIVRLGLPRIIRLKENAPELDYSSFLRQNRYWKTNYRRIEALCWLGNEIEQTNASNPAEF